VLDASRSGWEYETEEAPIPPQEHEDREAAGFGGPRGDRTPDLLIAKSLMGSLRRSQKV
jgi:hypothetical protein